MRLMLNQNFVILSVIIVFFGSIGYFIETLQGKVKPNKVSWFLWTISPLIAFFAQLQQGVGIQSLFTFSVGFIPLIIFLASFINKKAYWKIQRFDIICGALALLGLFLWYITKNGNIAILFSILSDFMASLPTIVKSYKAPETENYIAYFSNVISAAITLLTIKVWKFSVYAFPLYLFITTVVITVLIKFRIGKRFR